LIHIRFRHRAACAAKKHGTPYAGFLGEEVKRFLWRHARPRRIRLLLSGCLLVVFVLFSYLPSFAQSSARKVKTRVEPQYPDLARKNNISGSARVELYVTPDGKVREVKVLGGNPVLVQAVVSAVTKWKYEPAAEESTVVVKFDFNP
jgi:TonB family protein